LICMRFLNQTLVPTLCTNANSTQPYRMMYRS
jgi:hypothetical protein